MQNRNSKNIVTTLVLSILFIGCIFQEESKNKLSETENLPDKSIKLKHLFSSVQSTREPQIDLSDIDTLLVIPIDEGCESCIQKALTFAENKISTSYVFIITSLSNKVYQNRLNKYHFSDLELLKNKTNTLVDTSNLCFKLGISDMMPKLYFIQKGQIKDELFIDASNIDKVLK